MSFYKKNNSSHNSPSERITSAQESVALLGFPDTDDTFLTRVEVPIHFSGDLSDRACRFSLFSCFMYWAACWRLGVIITNPFCPFACWDVIGGCDLSAEASLNAPLWFRGHRPYINWLHAYFLAPISFFLAISAFTWLLLSYLLFCLSCHHTFL